VNSGANRNWQSVNGGNWNFDQGYPMALHLTNFIGGDFYSGGYPSSTELTNNPATVEYDYIKFYTINGVPNTSGGTRRKLVETPPMEPLNIKVKVCADTWAKLSGWSGSKADYKMYIVGPEETLGTWTIGSDGAREASYDAATDSFTFSSQVADLSGTFEYSFALAKSAAEFTFESEFGAPLVASKASSCATGGSFVFYDLKTYATRQFVQGASESEFTAYFGQCKSCFDSLGPKSNALVLPKVPRKQRSVHVLLEQMKLGGGRSDRPSLAVELTDIIAAQDKLNAAFDATQEAGTRPAIVSGSPAAEDKEVEAEAEQNVESGDKEEPEEPAKEKTESSGIQWGSSLLLLLASVLFV